jgi:predicted pyridoxine 5'-phosphate oxidase superfamily flavin-nucleotide-binding protein
MRYALPSQSTKDHDAVATLNADMKAIIRGTMLCFAATINADGSPNLSPKSTLAAYDDDHLLFANIASPGTVANLRRDPRIEINCIDIFARRGYRFTGHASVLSAGNAIYETLAAALKAEHGAAMPVHDAVLVRVHTARPILSPAYAYVPGTTEAGLREVYARKYGMAPLARQDAP